MKRVTGIVDFRDLGSFFSRLRSENKRMILLIIALFATMQLLSQNKINSYDPVWSPNGKKVAFYSSLDGDYEIYTINRDGTDLQKITNHDSTDSSPSWSPDGTTLLFTSKRSGNSELYSYSLSSTQIKQLTFTEGNEHASSWSPNGKLIAFESRIDGATDIYLMKSDGSGLKNLTKNKTNDFRPHWSKDGKHIYFQSKRSEVYQIHKMDKRGKKVEAVLESSTHQTGPSLMKAENKLIFANHEIPDTEVSISLLDLDDASVTNLTEGMRENLMLPSFSADDKEIVFVMFKERADIYIMDYEKRKVRRLTDF